MKIAINPKELSDPIGFNHGWLVESPGGARTLYLAGQCGYDRSGTIANPGDLVGQLRTALTNIGHVLRDARMEWSDVVQLNFYLRSRDDYAAARKEFGQVWKSLCGRHYPGMAMFMVSSLFDPEALIEIQGIAAS